MSRFRCPVPVCMLVLLLGACSAPQISTQALVPAGAPEATRYRVVAVVPFDGVGPSRSAGQAFSAQLESALAGIRVNDQLYFTVVDRQKVSEIMKEMALGQSGAMDQKTATRIGQLTGAKAIYTGAVTESKVSDARYSTTRTECSKDGKTCRDIPIPCTRRTATFTATPKLIEVETGRIVYSRSLSGTAASEACAGDGTALASQQELLQSAQKDAVLRVQADVAPHYVTVQIPLLEMNDGIEASANKEHLERGVTFAQKGRFDRACEEWVPAWQSEAKSPALAYDAGVCSELAGATQEALNRYQQADKLYTGTGAGMMARIPGMNVADPPKIIGAAIARMKERLKKQAELQQQSQ